MLNFLANSITNDKFSVFDADKKYSLLKVSTKFFLSFVLTLITLLLYLIFLILFWEYLSYLLMNAIEFLF